MTLIKKQIKMLKSDCLWSNDIWSHILKNVNNVSKEGLGDLVDRLLVLERMTSNSIEKFSKGKLTREIKHFINLERKTRGKLRKMITQINGGKCFRCGQYWVFKNNARFHEGECYLRCYPGKKLIHETFGPLMLL